MVEFCLKHGIKHDVCGKVIVATKEKELPLLENLFRRGLENGLSVTKLTARTGPEIEPHVRCLAGIKVPSTGIADYKGVCAKYAELIREAGRRSDDRHGGPKAAAKSAARIASRPQRENLKRNFS